MKTRKQKKVDIYIQRSQSSDGDCTCELLDTSLSKISDSDCSCSECQQAKLEAFNEIQLQDDSISKQNSDHNNRGQSAHAISAKPIRGISKNTIKNQHNKDDKLTRYKSAGKLRQNKSHTLVQGQQSLKQVQNSNDGDETFPRFSRECINDYITITQHRAREYLKQLKGTKKEQQLQRQRMQQNIKYKMYILKDYARKYKKKDVPAQKQKSKQGKDKKEVSIHKYKWNHKPIQFVSETFNRIDLQQQKQKIENHKNVVLQKINERIKHYKEKNKQVPYQCPDKCPHHHLRTSQTKIKQIQKFILKKAEQIRTKQKKEKAEEDEKGKIKEAKLRAIDLRSKELLAKSKKYNPEQERTSFHNSIDHFSTFSELKQNKQERDNQKNREKQIKKAIKKGGQLENAIYEDIQELIGQHPPIQLKKSAQKQDEQTPQKQQWCQKIVKQARLRPPKQIKQQDRSNKKKKQQRKQIQNNQKSYRNKMANDFKKQDKKRKQLQDEIERKKQEIMKEFQKRNSTNFSDNNKNNPKNKALREQYQHKLKYKESQFEPKQTSGKKQQKYDPYRQVYKNQPSKNPNQMKIVGDPLMQQFEYQRNIKRAQEKTNKFSNDIFSSSGASLLNKKELQV